jgi:hypothetical protein
MNIIWRYEYFDFRNISIVCQYAEEIDMNNKFLRTVCAVALISSTAVMSASSSATAKTSVSFCGKVVKLVEDHCIGVKNAGLPHTLYEITSAHPSPPLGWLIQGTGFPSSNPNICQQGTHLISVHWRHVHLCPL